MNDFYDICSRESLLGSPAFSDSEGITDGSVSEARREVDRDVLVPLLEP